jgi:LuxR family transcriptional regulator, maltose regulon positive regulatory protein
VVPGPLVETKLYVPQIRQGLVARPRLSTLLARGAGSRMTLVSAPAGFGKTTLLAEQQPIETVLAAVLNDLSALPGHLDLVLDDYHPADGRGIQAGVTYLLDHLPPQVRLVISTRSDPALPLARLRARGELVEIRAADLRFTPGEVTAYLDETVGPDLAPADIEALEQRTEGRAAALQLAALSLRGRDDVAGFIAGFAGEALEANTKREKVVVDGAHIGVTAHVTPTELCTKLDFVEIANGFANRFLHCGPARGSSCPSPA